MFASGRRFKVLTVRGIPLYVGSSWLWIAGLYLYAYYIRLSRSATEPSEAEALGLAFLGAVLFFGGVLIHESAHAVVARGFGLPVAGITLVFWGGATETRSNAKGPLAEFLVAFAGPASTLALAGAFWVTGEQMGQSLTGAIIRDLAFLNLLFAGLNALPGFPLDGGRMLLAVTWGLSKSRRVALRVAGYGGMLVGGLFLVGAFFGLQAGDLGRTIFFGYLGAILIGTGRATSARIALRDQLVSGTVADAMRPPPAAVPAEISLSEALDRWLRDRPQEAFPVIEQGRVIGTISMASARRVGARDPLRPVRDGTLPLNQTPVVAPEDTLDDAVEWLGGKPGLVLRGESLVGALDVDDVERWYQHRFEQRPDDREPDPLPPRPDF